MVESERDYFTDIRVGYEYYTSETRIIIFGDSKYMDNTGFDAIIWNNDYFTKIYQMISESHLMGKVTNEEFWNRVIFIESGLNVNIDYRYIEPVLDQYNPDILLFFGSRIDSIPFEYTELKKYTAGNLFKVKTAISHRINRPSKPVYTLYLDHPIPLLIERKIREVEILNQFSDDFYKNEFK